MSTQRPDQHTAGLAAELRSYYEEEASRGLRSKPLIGPRRDLRDRFIERLHREGRGRVVDFGAGPGRDCAGFVEAGIDVVGVDLAHGNAVAAARSGFTVVHGSVISPPFRSESFDAGWSMSTLMHLTEQEMSSAVAAMAATLVPGAPLQVGMWGGDAGERVDESIAGQRRRFFDRPLDVNTKILGVIGEIENSEEWDFGDTGRYHVISVRRRHRPEEGK